MTSAGWMARLTIRVCVAVVGLVLALDLAYLAYGSLEWFPTQEQQDRVRVVASAIAVVLVGVEVGLWVLLRLTVREQAVHD
jgi:hypothetical protein